MAEVQTTTEFYTGFAWGDAHKTPRFKLMAEEWDKQRRRLGRPLRVLDVGCGPHGAVGDLLDANDSYFGCDIQIPGPETRGEFEQVDLNTESITTAYAGQTFDVIVCSEVVEHLFDPDAALLGMKELIAPDGLVMISTPNLGYWLNRLLLLVGISPMFLENSSRLKFGRKLKALGQGNTTEGHIRLFTYGAMRDFLEHYGFELVGARSVWLWNFPPDKVIARFFPRLGPDNIYIARLRSS